MQIPLLQEIKTANDAQIPHRYESFLSWCKEMGMLNTSHNAIIAWNSEKYSVDVLYSNIDQVFSKILHCGILLNTPDNFL